MMDTTASSRREGGPWRAGRGQTNASADVSTPGFLYTAGGLPEGQQ